MHQIFDYFAAHAESLWVFAPLFCIIIWFAAESRWEAYTRKKNYQELILLNELREKSIITQEEFDEKKEELLSV